MQQGQEPPGLPWAQRVRQVILQVVQHELARAHFNQPGPAGPLCFAAILQRLMEGGYARPTDVHLDVQRIWAQCRAAAPPTSEMSRACDRLAPLVDMLWQHCQLDMAPTPSPPAVQQPLAPPQLSPAGAQHEAQQQQPMLQPAMQAGGWERVGPPGMAPAAGWGSPALPLPSMVVQQQQPLGNAVAQEHLALAHMRQADSQLALAQQQQAQLAMARQQTSPLCFSAGSAGSDGHAQQQQQQQQQLALAQRIEQQEREQRRIALLRLRQELMGEPGSGGQQPMQPPMQQPMQPPMQPPMQQPTQQPMQPQLQQQGPLSRETSTLAEQQQAWLDAMAQQRPPPPLQQAAGEAAPGDAQRLASLLLQGGSVAPLHERQRLVLAQLKQNVMRMQMQQRHEGPEAQQAAAMQLVRAEMAGAGTASPLPLLQQQLQQPFLSQQPSPPLQPQQLYAAQHLQQQQHPQLPFRAQHSLPLQQAPMQQLAGFGREEALSLPLSPTASMGANGHAHAARKRPALAAQMGAAVKEAAAARPGAGTAGPDSELRRGHPLSRCLVVLERLLQHEDAEPFSQPVDPEALGIPDYPQVITSPMDLGTIRGKLAPGRTEGWGMVAYKSTDEVLADVQLVWTNCRRYNAAGSPINDMCDAVEAAFCQLWEQAGLGTAAAAKAPQPAAPAPRAASSHQAGAASRSHHAAPPSKAQRSRQGGGSHKAAAHGRQQSHGKQSHAKQARGTPQGPSPQVSTAAGKAGGRKRAAAAASGGSKRQHVSPQAGQQQQAAEQQQQQQQQQQQPAEQPLLAPAVQQAEETEEGLELQRLLGTSIGPAATAAAVAAAAAAGGSAEGLPASPMAAGGSASPALWEAGPGPSLGAAGLVPQGPAAAAAGRPGAASGAAGQPPDAFLQRWQAAGSGPYGGALAGQDPRVTRALLHPDRDGGGGGSLPLLLPTQQAMAAPAAGPATATAQAPPDGLQAVGSMPSGLPSSVHLPVLSGLAAATAAVTPDQLQQEQRVLGAWQQVQQQRQLALRAMVAAERANAELFQARAEAAEAQAAAQAAAAAQPHSPEPRQSGNGASSEAGGRPAGVRLVPAGCGADLKTLAASVRQSRYLDLMQLGLQLFSKPFAALPHNSTAPPPAALNGTSSGGAGAAAGTQPMHSPMLACAVDCVTSCLGGKGTAGALAAGSGAEDAGAADAAAIKQETPQVPHPSS